MFKTLLHCMKAQATCGLINRDNGGQSGVILHPFYNNDETILGLLFYILQIFLVKYTHH